MTEQPIPNKTLLDCVNILKGYGFRNRHSIIELLLRVFWTKKSINKQEVNPDIVYKTMRDVSSSLPRFPGDEDLFFSIYKILSTINNHDILSFSFLANNGREPFVPDVLVEKFSNYITPSTKTVLVTECEQYSAALFDFIKTNPNIKFTLITQDVVTAELFTIAYSRFENVRLIPADIYSYGFINERFDLIFCIPVIGGRILIDGEDFISREPELIAVQNLLYHITLDGTLVIILPAKITFSGDSTASLRNYIETNYKIKEISAMPTGLFAPYSSTRTYLFVFSNGLTEDVVLKQYISENPISRISPCKKLVLEKELLLFSDEFINLNGWNIDMAFYEEDEDIRAFSFSSIKKMRLKDVATVFRGKAVNVKSETGNIAIINISNITDTGIEYKNLDKIEDEKRKVSRYILEDGDVLVTARGTTIKTAVFKNQPMICIPSVNINVIRPNDMLRGAYLKLFLASPVGVKMLRSLQRGTVVVNINYKDITELEVPVPPLAVQDALISEYHAGLELYTATIAAAEECWQNIQQNIQSKLF